MVGIIKTSTKQSKRKRSTQFDSAEQAEKARKLKDGWGRLEANHDKPLFDKQWGAAPPAPVRPPVRNTLPKGMATRPIRDFGVQQFSRPAPLPPQAPKLADHLKYDETMLAREKQAQVEIAKKQKQVGVLYNKGGLQFISNPDDVKTMGRKV